MELKTINKNKLIALLIAIVVMIQIFTPFGMFSNVSNAASTPQQPAVVIKRSTDIGTHINGKWFQVQFAFVGDFYPYTFDLKLKYDGSKIEPANKSTKKKVTKLADSIMQESSYATTFMTSTSYLDTAEQTFRLIPNTGEPSNPIDYEDEEGMFNGYMLIYTMTFRLVDESLTEDDLTTDLLTLSPTAATAGFKFGWDEDEQNGNPTPKYSEDSSYLKFVGFTESTNSSRTIESISVEKEPSKTEYDHGDKINLDGGQIKVTYNEGEPDYINMTDPKVSISSGETADVNNPQVTVKYEGKEASFNIVVNDPVESLAVSSPMNNVEYSHDDNFDFTELQLLATKKSGATETLSSNSEGVTISELKADVNSSNFNKTSAEGVVPESGTQKITFSYEGKKAYQTVAVNDTIAGIDVIKQPTKKVYKYGENIDLTGAVAQALLGSGNKTNINLPDGSVQVGNYDNTSTGSKQELQVSFNGFTAEKTIDVEFYNYIKESSLKLPSDVNPNYNTDLNLSGGQLNLVWQNNNTTSIDLTDPKISIKGYDKTKIGTQEITVEYTENYVLSDGTKIPEKIIKTFNVNVENSIKSIAITAPEKAEYKHGESLATNGKIVVTYANNDTEDRTMDATMIFEEDGTTLATTTMTSYNTTTNKENKTLKITYEEDSITETIEYPITIINTVTEAVLHGRPKTQYNVNDPIDDNLEILVTREIGTPTPVKVTTGMISNFSTTEEGTRTAVITYKENGVTKTVDYTYTVTDTVKSVSIGTAPEEAQKYGEELDLTGATIEVEKGSKTETKSITKEMIKEGTYNKETLGEQTVTVEYGVDAEGNPLTTTFKVVVKDYVTGIKVNPNTVTGKYNEELSTIIDDNNIKYTVTYAKEGDKITNTLPSNMVSGYDKTSEKTQNLTVTYTDNDENSFTNGEDFSADLSVTLSDKVTEITIDTPLNKTSYGYNDTIDLTGGKITVTKESGRTEEKLFTDDGVTVTETDGSDINFKNVIFEDDNTAEKTIQVNYGGKSKEFTITIINKITGIEIKTTPKTNYKVNDEFSYKTQDGTKTGTIEVTRENGNKSIVNLDDSKVKLSGFDNSEEINNLPITVKYTENGVTKSTTYEVNIIDNILNVEIKTTPKTQYKYGDSLDITTGTLLVTKDSGTKTIPMTKDMITELDGEPFNGKILGTRNLNITYGGTTLTYEITVSDYVKDIILTPPTKVKYEYGESLNLDGGSVQKVMASGAATSPVALTDNTVTLSAFDPTKEGTQTIEVTYEGKNVGNFALIVEDNVQSIEMVNTPKTQYKYGESLDLKGGTILATRTSTKEETIKLSNTMVSGYNPNKLGEQKLTVTYKGKTTNYVVNVEDYIADISIVKPNKLVYKLNEELDLSGGKVSVIMASGAATSPVAMTNAMIQGFDSSSEGAKLIKVTYQGITKTFGITVVDELSSVTLKTLPDKLDYRYGENLELTGGALEVIKESGATKTVKLTKDMVLGYNPKKLGQQKITVTYEGFKNEFYVNVEDYVSKLNIEKPTKLEYEYGESLDLSGGKVSVIMASGKIDETVQMTASMVSEFNSKQLGKQIIKVEYKDLQGTFQVNVVDKVKGISIDTEPNKIKYEYGEKIDLTGATISVIKSSGITTIPITNKMISGYNAKNPGTQIITVTYEGFKTKFVVIVNEKPANPQNPEQPQEPQKPTNPQKPQQPVKPQNPDKTQGNQNSKPNNNKVIKPNDTIIDKVQDDEKVNTPIDEPLDEPLNDPLEQQTTDETKDKEEKSEGKDNNNKTQKEEDKLTQTLGVKDEKDDDSENRKLFAGTIGSIGILILLILIFFKRNVKIYVEEEGEFVLGGLDKISSKNAKLDINKYLDGNTYPNKVKICLSDSISEKLDGKEIEIKHRGKIIKHNVDYKGKPYEFILE